MAGFLKTIFGKDKNKDQTQKSSEKQSAIIMGSFEGEAISWDILKREEDRLLIISSCALDTRTYHDAFADTCWADCALRKWLNGEFYEQAFTAEEKDQILETHISTADSTLYKTKGGPDCQDRLFLLSLEEAKEYKEVNRGNVCLPTAYAKKRGAYTNTECEACWWWLRTPARWQNKALTIDSQGEVNMYGRRVDTDVVTVRPAMWIRYPVS